MTLFSATLIARDKSSALLQRLYTTPLTALDFILGYTLPIAPIAIAQSLICYLAALALGLPFSVNILYAVLLMLPVSLLYIGLGLLCGSVLNDKQVGGICGALLTNLSAWLSGIWFDLELVGGAFRKIAYMLPFVHAVELERAALSGNFAGIFPHLWWVLGYAAVILAAAVLLFLRQMKRQ
jgi:ABC-2 type transport system permease protein